MRRMVRASRYIILFAVASAFLAAVGALIYGSIATLRVVVDLTASGQLMTEDIPAVLKSAKTAAVAFIEMIDLLLLGTVLYIVALGLYELFIDPELDMPDWLIISDLDDLKHKLLGVIIVLLAVTFLSDATEWDGSPGFLNYGLAIGAVVLAFAAYIVASHWAHKRARHEHRDNHDLPE